MTDFRALCAELLAVFDSYDDESNLVGIFDDMKANKNDLLDRARAALAAEPEPKRPTSEELLALWHGDRDYRAVPFARAVLARWGHHPASGG